MRVPGVPFVQGRNDYSDSDGRKYGIAIHNTSNDATAEGEASYATRRTDGISAHLYVDRDSVVQSLDTGDRAGHAGSNNGNQHAVAVEITGVNGWTRQQWLDRVAWSKLGAALAHVVRKYGIAVRRASVSEMKSNPRVKAFYSHDDMRRAWGGTSHTDPGGNFPWDRLFQSVNAALAGNNLEEEEDDMFTDDHATKLNAVYQQVFYGTQSGGDVVAPDNGRDPSNSLINKLDKTGEALASLAIGGVDVAALAELLKPALIAALTADLLPLVRSEVRDAVADHGEGGADRVRAG